MTITPSENLPALCVKCPSKGTSNIKERVVTLGELRIDTYNQEEEDHSTVSEHFRFRRAAC